MSTRHMRAARGGSEDGQAMVEYLVCTVLVALALLMPLDGGESAGERLIRAFEELLVGFAWLVAVA